MLSKLNSIVETHAKNPLVSELKIRVSNSVSGFNYNWQASGSKDTHLITSSTKMFAVTVMQQLADEGKLDFADAIAKHLPPSDYENLNVQDGIDCSEQITIRDILSHTSGIADYYQMKRLPRKGDLALISSQDPGWSFQDTISLARQLPAKFAPNSGKAHYSFTNYQLVGRLIEQVTSQPLSEALRTRIFEPLELSQTSLLTPENLEPFYNASPVLIGKQNYLGARRIASLGAEGSVVSSTADTTRFLQSFFTGELLSKGDRDNLLAKSLPIFPGIRYSAGVMVLSLPRFATKASHSERYLGHSGASGHIMFFDPIQKLSIVATINQLKPSTIPYRVMASVLRVINSA